MTIGQFNDHSTNDAIYHRAVLTAVRRDTTITRHTVTRPRANRPSRDVGEEFFFYYFFFFLAAIIFEVFWVKFILAL